VNKASQLSSLSFSDLSGSWSYVKGETSVFWEGGLVFIVLDTWVWEVYLVVVGFYVVPMDHEARLSRHLRRCYLKREDTAVKMVSNVAIFRLAAVHGFWHVGTVILLGSRGDQHTAFRGLCEFLRWSRKHGSRT